MTDAKYNSEIYQLDELINDLYSAIYSKSPGFKVKYIDTSDLKMNRFKMSDYDLDMIFEKTKIQLSGEFLTGLFLKDNEPVKQIAFKRQGETHQTMIRIIEYFDKDSVTNINNPVNVNQVIRTLLSELVVSDKTNNILLPIINVDVIGTDLSEYEKVEKYIDKKKFYSIEITEKFYKYTTLENFLQQYPVDDHIIKTILFQVIDVLYQINQVYPGFHHNQLFPEMIGCYLKTKGDTIYPEIKLDNFFLSEIDEIISNDIVKKYKIPYINNHPYADLYQFLNYFWNNDKIDLKKYPKLIKIFDEILPAKLRSTDKFLESKKWDSLSDDEKNSLKIKNIRNHQFFLGDNLLVTSNFVENNANNSPSDVDTLNFQNNMKRVDQTITSTDNISPEKISSEELSIPIIKKKTDKIPKLSCDEPSEADDENKKYSNIDIDTMKNHKKDKKNINSESNMSDEKTEEDKPTRIDSKIIIVSESDKPEKKKSKHTSLKRVKKAYHGTRHIISKEPIGSIPDNKTITAPFRQEQNINVNGVPSRINSIGALFGTNSNDYNRQSQQPYQFDISQYASQISPNQYNVHQTQIPGPVQNPIGNIPQTPPQMPMQAPSQIPVMMPQQMPQQMSQQMPPQSYEDAMSRYLAASGTQIDPNIMNGYLPQNGGNGKNPFFFQR